MSSPTLDRAEDAARAALVLLGREDGRVEAERLPQGVQLEVTQLPGIRVPIRVVLTWRELTQPHWRDLVRRRLTDRPAL